MAITNQFGLTMRPFPPRSFFSPPPEAPPPSTSAGGDRVTLSVAAQDWVVPFGAHSGDKKKDANLQPIDKPDPNLPDAWAHPPSSRLDGKCGITGCANMLRLYGIEKEPVSLDQSRYRSLGPGMRSGKFAENLTELSGKKFEARSIPADTDPLELMRANLKAGKPMAIQYMTGPTNAHWVVITGVKDTPDGPKLQMQSWGGYYEAKWDDMKGPWERGYGGPFPYVVGEEAAPKLPK